jgi:hypothetical protein
MLQVDQTSDRNTATKLDPAEDAEGVNTVERSSL